MKDCAGRWKLADGSLKSNSLVSQDITVAVFFLPIKSCSQEERETPHLLEIVKAAKAAAKPKRQGFEMMRVG